MESSERHQTPFQALFEREFVPHIDAVYRYAYRLTRDHAKAEDLLQETFLRAWRFIDRYREGTNPRAWLFKICYRLFANNYRSNKGYSTFNYEEWARTPDARAYDAKRTVSVCENDLSEELLSALHQLSERARHALFLLAEGYSYKEISEELGVPINTVRTTIHRARERLARRFLHLKRVRWVVWVEETE